MNCHVTSIGLLVLAVGRAREISTSRVLKERSECWK